MVKGRCPVASLGDDLAVEILSRLPLKSLCRSKCVSRSWRDLITHPDHRRKLAQTLTGFFHNSHLNFPAMSALDFANVSGKSLAFLAEYHKGIRLLDCCNGLLLCLCLCHCSAKDGSHYIVCNPATEKWVALPTSSASQADDLCLCGAFLAFDPAVSCHFHVVEYVDATGLEVYSSKTGGWVHKENRWNGHGDITPCLIGHHSAFAFLNGCLHFLTFKAVAAVDTEGKTWREIRVPVGGMPPYGFIQLSQGHLHYADFQHHHRRGLRLVVYVLEDYGSQRWTMKHSVETLFLFGGRGFTDIMFHGFVAIHPERNLIFFAVGRDKTTLMSYDMDRRHIEVVCDLGPKSYPPYLPYVPLYSEFAHAATT